VLSCGGGGDGSTGPAVSPPKPGLTISGANITDTIGAQVTQRLVVVLRDSTGQPVAGQQLNFSALQGANFQPLVRRLDPTSGLISAAFSVTTGTDGSVSLLVILGDIPGPAGFALQTTKPPVYKDTARYTVLPGAPATFVLAPKDTAVLAGKTYALGATVLDRRRNVVTGSPTLAYRALDASISLSSSQQVTTNAVARSGVLVSLGSILTDTAWVSVVPSGTMAIRKLSTVKVVNLDGTLVADAPVPTGSFNDPLPIPPPEWTPDGQAFYTHLGFQYAPQHGLFRVDLAGTQTLVSTCTVQSCPPNSFGLGDFQASVGSFTISSDGRTLYASVDQCNYEGLLYRAQMGSTAAPQRLSPPDGNDCFDTVHRWPSVSPDGTTLAFENDSSYFTGPTIQFMDIATRTVRPFRPGGERPRWSPLGDQVAFVNQQSVWVMRPDGTGLRRVTSQWAYVAGQTWSSDGKWILAHATVRGSVTVVAVQVATGLELPLAFTSGWLDAENGAPVPVWRPGS
jgi:hypothetical protein